MFSGFSSTQVFNRTSFMTIEKSRILYIDDDVDNLTVFTITFRQYYKVFTALSGEAALDILRTNEVQVIITDQRMPGMTGAEFLHSIIPIYPEPIRMIATGFSDIGAVIAAINEADVYRYITKPWNAQDLKVTIDGAIEMYTLRRQNQALLVHLEQYNKQLEETVTERTKALQVANEELRQFNEQLQQLDQEKNEILNIVSHDLRNPLSSILLVAETFNDEPFGKLPEGYQQFTDEVFSAARRMARLIANLLDADAIENGRVPLHLVTFDAEFVGTTVVDDYMTRAAVKNITLHFQHVGATVIHADENMTYQIFENLLSNAIKYSPHGRSVWLTITDNDEFQCNIQNTPIAQPSAFVYISVRDEGPGINAEDKKRLFGKFARLTAQPTGNEESVGLGLSITKRLAESMGGHIWCESEPESGVVGSTFIVALPAAEQE